MIDSEELVQKIYRAYGSDSGYLFGLNPNQRPIVAAIVKAALQFIESEDV
jgi:hypothetical protein